MEIKEEIKEKNSTKKDSHIPINIWDDYYEDGFVPKGEKNETFIYVEVNEQTFTDIEKKDILIFLKNKIDSYNFPIKTRIFIYDTKVQYPNLDFEELGLQHWNRPEIRVENLTHKLRLELLELLKESKIEYRNSHFFFYSES